MSAIRFHKVIKQLEEGLVNLGYSKAKAKWLGENAAGEASGYMNFTDATSSAGDLQFFIQIKAWEVAGNVWPESMRTQSHAKGQFIEGPGLVELVLEAVDMSAPSSGQLAQEKFAADIVHIIRGQNSATVRLFKTAPGVLPTLNGVNGAGADVKGAQVGVLLPYGRAVAVGNMA